MSRKQALLRHHRRNKRIALLTAVLLLIMAGVGLAWWAPLIMAVLGWVAHEAWFADHLFYSPKQSYQYRFAEGALQPQSRWNEGVLSLDTPLPPSVSGTIIVEVQLRSTWLGRFFDPCVLIGNAGEIDTQAFERGCMGTRYLNLSGAGDALAAGVRLKGRYCQLLGAPVVRVFDQPEYQQQRVMVIAPHADDAELAAFGLYSQAKEAWIVTLTAGEIEAEHYQAMGLEPAQAAQLKGRLRAWDSVAVPRWAGVPEHNCVQLGYFCLQLEAMHANPDQPIASREAGLSDTRLYRQYNSMELPGDTGQPTWSNLVADLRALITQARPQLIVVPDPTLDPHPDHVQAHLALKEALQGLDWQPTYLLGYANHLHDNDRWPMGNAHQGVALPPRFDEGVSVWPVSLPLSAQQRINKAMALGMMHDLQPPLPLKRRLRRALQRALAGREWPAEGENEFFRKAVRRHELLWRLVPEPLPTVH